MIPDDVCIAAIETLLQPLGTSLRHYMPASKAAAIEAMRGIIASEREECAQAANGVDAAILEGKSELFVSVYCRARVDAADAIREVRS